MTLILAAIGGITLLGIALATLFFYLDPWPTPCRHCRAPRVKGKRTCGCRDCRLQEGHQ